MTHPDTAQVNDSLQAYNIEMYPNPAKDYTVLYYTIDLNQSAELQIFDQLGQLIVHSKLSGADNRLIIRTNNLQDGVYNYSFVLREQVIKRDKFVVVR